MLKSFLNLGQLDLSSTERKSRTHPDPVHVHITFVFKFAQCEGKCMRSLERPEVTNKINLTAHYTQSHMVNQQAVCTYSSVPPL